jgi:hypothetical protein
MKSMTPKVARSQRELASHLDCRTAYGRIPDASGIMLHVKERAIATGDWSQYLALQRSLATAAQWLEAQQE